MIEPRPDAEQSNEARAGSAWLCLIGWREELPLPEAVADAVNEPGTRIRAIDEGTLRAFVLESDGEPAASWPAVHAGLIAATAAAAAVIPTRAGCRFRSVSGVRAMLRDHEELLGLALENVAGASEFRISVRCPEIAGDADATVAGRGRILDSVLAPLQEVSRASCRRRIRTPRAPGAMAQWSFLVADEDREAFLAAAQVASDDVAAVGLDLECSGPGIPEGFVPRVMVA